MRNALWPLEDTAPSPALRSIDVGAPKDFGIKFLNLECKFLRREMCQSVAFSASHRNDIGRDLTLELGVKVKTVTPQAPRALFIQGPYHILHSLSQTKCM